MLISLMQQQIAVLETLRLERSKRQMHKLVRNLDEEDFKILVLGGLKRGKSTLINALLGQDILPSGAVPITEYLAEIKWGELSRAPVKQPDRLKSVSEKVMFDDVKRYITEYEEQHSPTSSYEKIELRLPLDFCRDGLTLIDSPGLDLLDNQEQMVTNLLSSAAAVIFVLAGDYPLSTSEMRAIEFIRMSGHRDIFFVINRIDVVPPDERNRLQEYLLAKLRSFLGEEIRYVFFVSALQALKGQLSSDQELLDASGLLAIEKELKTFVATKWGWKKLLVSATGLQASVDEAQRTISEVTIVSKTSWKLTRKNCTLIEKRLKALEEERTSVVQFFKRFLARLEDEIYKAANDFCTAVANKISDWVDEYELKTPMRLLETFSSSSRERVVEEVSRFITSKVERELDKWQKSMLEPLLNQKLGDLSQELNHRVQRFARGLEEIHLKIITDLQPVNSVNTLVFEQESSSARERITLFSSQLFLENASIRSTKPYLKNDMTNFTYTLVAIASPSLSKSLVPAIDNLLSVIIAPNIAGIIVGMFNIINMSRDMNRKIKDAVAQQYIRTFRASSNELANKIAKNIVTQLQFLQESLDNTLDLEIKNLRDKINLILSEQQNQAHVNKEYADFAALSRELDMIKNTLSTLIEQISLLEVASRSYMSNL